MSRMARGLLLLSFVLALSPSLRAQDDPADGKAAAFWTWFAAHSEELAKVVNGREPVCRTLAAELTKVEKGLTWEFGPTKDGVREFTISADGAKELFRRVKAVIAAAPALPAWKLVAFRQRKSIDKMTMEVDGARCDVGQILFRAAREGAKVGVEVYVPGMTPKNEKAVMTQGFILLDYSVGEVGVETRIGSIEFLPLTDKVNVKGLRPLPELAAEVDRLGK